MIDIHMHVGLLFRHKEMTLTPDFLLDFMDRNDIEKAVLLPMENPEGVFFYVTTREVLDVCRRHPDRFIPFCNVDPRMDRGDTRTDFYSILEEYRDLGCKGFGEGLARLYIDDPRLLKIYEACGKLNMPVCLDMDGERNMDEVGLPRLTRILRDMPDAVFFGHGPHFWSEISGDCTVEQMTAYPPGKVAPGGAVPRLLAECPNMHGDLSAGSAYNALTRDMEFGYQFLEEFQDKLLFGTDISRPVEEDVKIVSYINNALAEGKISQVAYEKITRRNAERLLGLGI